MKRRLILIVLCTFAFAATSCRKDDGSIRTPDNDMSETAKVIITKDGSNEETMTLFSKTAVYRKSELEGKSHFMASSGGKMVYDAFMLSIYFECIDNLNAGDTIIPSRCMFSFFCSSDSNATTYEYEGTISLADKSADQVIIHFDKVKFTCSFGEYIIDGYLNCPLYERYDTQDE